MFENIATLKKYISNCYPSKIKIKKFVYKNNTFFSILSCVFCKESVMTYDNIKGHRFICEKCKNSLFNTRIVVIINNTKLKETYNNKFILCTEIDWNPYKPYQGQKYLELRKIHYDNGIWKDSKKEEDEN